MDDNAAEFIRQRYLYPSSEFLEKLNAKEREKNEDCKEIKRVRRGRRGGKKVRGRSEHAKLLSRKHECYGAKHKVPEV